MRASLVVLVACGHPAAPPPIANTPPPTARPPALLGKLSAQPAVTVIEIGDTLYAGGAGPLVISHDHGKTFTPWQPPSHLCVGNFVAAGQTAYVIASRCTTTDVKTDPDSLFRSIDAGVTWDTLGTTSAILRGIDVHDPRVLYADDVCGRSTVCRSDDGGATWHAIAVPPPSQAYATIEGTLFVADDGGLLYAPPHDRGFELDRSDDRGATWHPAISAPSPADVGLSAVTATGAILGEDLDHCAIVRSTGGRPFTTVFTPHTCEPGSRMTGHGHYACGVFGDDQIVASDDDGATWHDLNLPHAGFEHEEAGLGGIHHVSSNARWTCLAGPDRILVGADDGLFALASPWREVH